MIDSKYTAIIFLTVFFFNEMIVKIRNKAIMDVQSSEFVYNINIDQGAIIFEYFYKKVLKIKVTDIKLGLLRHIQMK